MSKPDPIFKSIFGIYWEVLPPVFKKHYANRPYSEDVFICEGTLNVKASAFLRLIYPILKLMGSIPAKNESNVPVQVTFKSEKDSKYFYFIRTFKFEKGRTYFFHSKMIQQGGNRVAERMKLGMTWLMNYRWENDQVILEHRGYAFHFLGMFIPLPLTYIIGRVDAAERAIDDNNFEMFLEINHWAFGKIYGYRGQFTMVSQNG